jgi:predicted dehydrogenase
MKAIKSRPTALPKGSSRRHFLQTTGAGVFTLLLTGHRAFGQAGKVAANEKLNLGVVGVSGRGGDNLQGVSRENIVALCDTDENNLNAAAKRFPGAKTYFDFRELLDQKGIDAVVVSTPDHCHAVVSMGALRSGRHLYCEKPLARTVSEARIVTDTARKSGLVTQLGTQIHAGNNYRRVVELVQSGAIGPVKEVHVWSAAVYGGKDLPKEFPPAPAHLHYDLWLGPLEPQPYSPEFVPFKWRNWWAFGGGSLADFGCHFMDLPHWALGLTHPVAIEPLEGPPVHPDAPPPWLIVKFEHPARGQQPPVTVTWYHGGKQPKQLTDTQKHQWKSGVLFVGAKGQLISNYQSHVLLPEKEFENFQPPAPTIPNSIGHHQEWIQAIKTGGKTTCPLDYSGPLSETALLGNVAYRVGKRLAWNAATLKAANCPEADAFVQHKYRQGWKL